MSALEPIGQNRSKILFAAKSGSRAVVVNTRYMTTELTTVDAARQSTTWRALSASVDPLVTDIAEGAIAASIVARPGRDLGSNIRRDFTVPGAVKNSAVAALQAGNLSAASKRAATMLSTKKQVSCADVLWVHRFFDNVDNASATPSKLAAWGGSHGRVWAAGLAGRLGYDSVVADAGDFSIGGLEPFSDGDETTRAFWGHVVSSGFVDGVFRVDGQGNWLAWGNSEWFSTNKPDNRVELDDETALYACGALLDSPDSPVDLRAVSATEWALADRAYEDLDFEILDRVLVAAAGDGEYTPDERSKNASSQLRDANGRFAKVGDSGLMKSGLRGKISTVNQIGGQIIVSAEDGNSYMIPPKDFTIDGGDMLAQPAPGQQMAPPKNGKGTAEAPQIPRLDLSGILGQPRATKTTPKAFLKSVLQPMGPKQLKQVVSNYEAFIKSERQQRAKDFKGGTGWQESRPAGPEQKKREKALRAAEAEAESEYQNFIKKYAFKRSVKAAAGEDKTPIGSDKPVLEPAGGFAGTVTPDNSDVPPLFMALVDPEDTRAVLELVSIVPAGPSSPEATTFKRVGAEWVADPKIMQDLRSATPPPTVMLEQEELESVLEQVDNEPIEPEGEEEPTEVTAAAKQVILTLAAAGGADRNRGNAETLRRYWTRGEGGVKIRWNTGGDWRRCVRYLSKHLGPRAKGYCSLRHKEMTGMWPGDKRNRKEYSMNPDGQTFSSLEDVKREPAVIRAAAYAAEVDAAMAKIRGEKRVPVPATAADIDEGRAGRSFVIPIVVPEGVSSGDKRHFQKGSLGIRSLPLPLLWQPLTGEGHDGSPIVGRIDAVERTSAGLGNAYGVFDTGPYGREAQRLVENNMLRWVSVDLDKFEVDEEMSERDPDGKMNIKKGRMMAATLVAKPAFQECTLELLPVTEETEIPAMPDESATLTASAGIAASIPVEPPEVWFNQPVLNGPSPIRVTDEGQVFGHIATWSTSHVGLPGSTKPPRSATDYAYFHTGMIRTNSGKDVKVGQLTLAGGHADLGKDAVAAAKHYDDTASAVADVHAGEDRFGIWVAGALRPGVTPEQVRTFRASAPSGDWRFIPGVGLEMIAVCQVNVPGFPVPQQALAASGQPNALVAAGTADLVVLQAAEHSGSENIMSLAAAANQKILDVLDVQGYMTRHVDLDEASKKALVASGYSLPNGSFQIKDATDVRRAVIAHGMADRPARGGIRRHVVRRARALSREDLVPKNWREASLSDKDLEKRDSLIALVSSARAKRAQELTDRLNRPALEAKAAELFDRIEKR